MYLQVEAHFSLFDVCFLAAIMIMFYVYLQLYILDLRTFCFVGKPTHKTLNHNADVFFFFLHIEFGYYYILEQKKNKYKKISFSVGIPLLRNSDAAKTCSNYW